MSRKKTPRGTGRSQRALRGGQPARHLDLVLERLEALEKSGVTNGRDRRLLSKVLEELRVTLDELQAAEDELLERQNQLLAARDAAGLQAWRYQELFELAPEPYVVTDREGSIREANLAATALLDLSHRFLIGKPLTSFVIEADRRAFREELARHSGGEDPPLHEAGWSVRLRSRRGKLRDVSLTLTLVQDEAGQPTGIRWLLRDITAQKRVESELRQSQERYRAFIEHSSEAVWRIELEQPLETSLAMEKQLDHIYRWSYLAECNDAMARMYGYHRAEELAGARLGDLLPRSEPRNLEFLLAFLESGYRLCDAESREIDRYGDSKYFLNNLVGIVDSGRLLRAWGTQRDITDRKRTEDGLSRLAAIVSSSDDAIIGTTLEGIITSWNPGASRIYGYAQSEVMGRPISLLAPPGAPDEVGPLLEQVRLGEHIRPHYLLRVTRDGRPIHVSLTISPTRDGAGHLTGAASIARDISARVQMEQALFTEREYAQVTLQCISDAVLRTDREGVIEYLNPVAEQLTGWPSAEARGQPVTRVLRLVHETGKEAGEHPVLRCLREGRAVDTGRQVALVDREDREFAVEGSAVPIGDKAGERIGAVVAFRDVTKARALAQALSHEATHDGLTGLVNRLEFGRRLERVLVDARNNRTQHTLCYLDLDQFKVVNDTCGHVAGDELLRQVGRALQARMRKRDTLARLGGDEFGVLLEHCSTEQGGRVAAELLQTVKDFRFVWDGKPFAIGVSIGLVSIGSESRDLATVLNEADAACYAAKESGRNRVHVFQPDDANLARRYTEMQLVTSINEALERNGFRLYRQPIVPLDPGEQTAARCEFLVRMVDARGGMIPPGAFLPGAERYGLMPAIDRWVIRQVIARYLVPQLAAGVTPLPVASVNLSAPSLGDTELIRFVHQELLQHAAPGASLCFEINEPTILADLNRASRFIAQLRKLGCAVALDDFGTGVSSLGYLRSIEVDFLKIGGSLVRKILDDPIDRAVVDAINDIGHLMQARTVAEEVESAAVLEELRRIGVDYAQGFALGAPQPLGEA